MTDTFDADLKQFEADAESLARRTNPEVRELVLKADVEKIRQEHGTDRMPEKFLTKDYQQQIWTEAASRFDSETREDYKAALQRCEEMRAAATAAVDRARRLGSEASRINPEMNHNGWLQARLLDAMTENQASEWLDAHAHEASHDGEKTPNPILQRYRASMSNERAESAFVRLCEQRYGFKPGESTDGPRMLSSLASGIRERQEARVPKAWRDRLQRIEAAEAAILKARGAAIPTDENINGAIRAIAGGKR